MNHVNVALARSALAATVLGLLAACGGGATDDPTSLGTAADNAAESVLHTAEVVVAPMAAEERRALAARYPDTPDALHFLVTLNPAAVDAVETRSAAMLSADTPARSRTAAAIRTLAAQTVSGHRASVHTHYAHALQGFAVSVPESDADGFVTAMAAHPAVARIEQNRQISVEQSVAPEAAATGAASLVSAGVFWGLDRIDQGALPLNQVYANTRKGSGVRAYIMDSGIQPHQEFGNRLLPGFDAIASSIDGRYDCNGHGTHVAGTVGGTVTGVAPGVSLIPVRVLDCAGTGDYRSLVNGAEWIIAHGVRPAVVNLSLGVQAVSPTLDALVVRMVAAGFTVVVAAGNSSASACQASPARAPESITVGATDANDDRASFSNVGSCLDLFAPGVKIMAPGYRTPDGLVYKHGTSMAAPHVAGAAALLLQDRPWLLPAQVATQLLAQASPTTVRNAGTGSPNKLLFAGPATPLAFNPPGDIHVSALSPSGRATTSQLWTALVTVDVRTAAQVPMKGVVVTAAASASAKPLTCTTAANGRCSLSLAGLKRSSAASVGFVVTNLSAEAQTYRPAANTASSATARRP